jgi:serine/threonine-protein kinase RsbW
MIKKKVVPMGRGERHDRVASSLHHHGPASPELAARLRRQLVRWVRSEGVGADTANDIALACYEAMANTITHAYPSGTVGPLELHAWLDHDSVVVTVADRGQWSEPEPRGTDALSGRGLALIRNLADDAEVRPGEYGTTVRMTWPRHAA